MDSPYDQALTALAFVAGVFLFGVLVGALLF
jgi:hypothetical protein